MKTKQLWTEYEWQQQGDEWSAEWGQRNLVVGHDSASHPRLRPDRIDPRARTGSWQVHAVLKDLCQQLTIVDLTMRCIKACQRRFSSESHITYHVNDGKSLEMIPDDSTRKKSLCERRNKVLINKKFMHEVRSFSVVSAIQCRSFKTETAIIQTRKLSDKPAELSLRLVEHNFALSSAIAICGLTRSFRVAWNALPHGKRALQFSQGRRRASQRLRSSERHLKQFSREMITIRIKILSRGGSSWEGRQSLTRAAML